MISLSALDRPRLAAADSDARPRDWDERWDGWPGRPRAPQSAASRSPTPAASSPLAFERGEGDERARMTTTSYVTYAAIRDDVPAFSGAAAWQRNSTTATIDGEQVRADVMLVSGNYFDVLGAKARLGRPVQRDDDRAAAAPVVVLSHAFWKSAFGGDPDVLGRRVNVERPRLHRLGRDAAAASAAIPPRTSTCGSRLPPRCGSRPAGTSSRTAGSRRSSRGWRPARRRPRRRRRRAAATSGAVVLTPLGGADVSRRRSARRLLADGRLGARARHRPRERVHAAARARVAAAA